jgi:hypothetical protein
MKLRPDVVSVSTAMDPRTCKEKVAAYRERDPTGTSVLEGLPPELLIPRSQLNPSGPLEPYPSPD